MTEKSICHLIKIIRTFRGLLHLTVASLQSCIFNETEYCFILMAKNKKQKNKSQRKLVKDRACKFRANTGFNTSSASLQCDQTSQHLLDIHAFLSVKCWQAACSKDKYNLHNVLDRSCFYPRYSLYYPRYSWSFSLKGLSPHRETSVILKRSGDNQLFWKTRLTTPMSTAKCYIWGQSNNCQVE